MSQVREKVEQVIRQEQQTLNLVRNALIAHGQELDASTGDASGDPQSADHWHAIKATIAGLATQFEQGHIEYRVAVELQEQMGKTISALEALMADADKNLSKAEAAALQKAVAHMREIYDARFSPAKISAVSELPAKEGKKFSAPHAAQNMLQDFFGKTDESNKQDGGTQ